MLLAIAAGWWLMPHVAPFLMAWAVYFLVIAPVMYLACAPLLVRWARDMRRYRAAVRAEEELRRR